MPHSERDSCWCDWEGDTELASFLLPGSGIQEEATSTHAWREEGQQGSEEQDVHATFFNYSTAPWVQ